MICQYRFSFSLVLVTKVFNFSFFVQHSGLLAIFGHRKDILLLVKENESMRSCSLRRIYVPWSIRVKNPKYYKHFYNGVLYFCCFCVIRALLKISKILLKYTTCEGFLFH